MFLDDRCIRLALRAESWGSASEAELQILQEKAAVFSDTVDRAVFLEHKESELSFKKRNEKERKLRGNEMNLYP